MLPSPVVTIWEPVDSAESNIILRIQINKNSARRHRIEGNDCGQREAACEPRVGRSGMPRRGSSSRPVVHRPSDALQRYSVEHPSEPIAVGAVGRGSPGDPLRPTTWLLAEGWKDAARGDRRQVCVEAVDTGSRWQPSSERTPALGDRGGRRLIGVVGERDLDRHARRARAGSTRSGRPPTAARRLAWAGRWRREAGSNTRRYRRCAAPPDLEARTMWRSGDVESAGAAAGRHHPWGATRFAERDSRAAGSRADRIGPCAQRS